MTIRMFAFLIALPFGAALAQPPGDQWLTKPVDDRTFAAFKSFYTYDHNLPLDVQMTELDTTGGMRMQHLSYQSTPGIRVTARAYSVASGNSQRRPALILLHGGGGPGKDAAAMRILSDYMARAGFLVLNIDMQFFGERAGDVLTSFTEAEKHDKLYNQPAAQLAWVMQTIKDVGRGYDFLANTMDADPKRIGLMGISRGAIMATVVGGADQRIAAVALILGGHFDALEKIHEAAACPANYIGRIAPRPLFMINGENDADMFRQESVLPLQRLAKEPKDFVWLPSGHSMPREEFPRMATWLQAKLR
jgi:dienelactone hydrolase